MRPTVGVSTEVPPVTMHELPQQFHPDGALVYRLLFEWRARCLARHATWQLTVNRRAAALCAAVAAALEYGDAPPNLTGELETWALGVGSAADVRAALFCLSEAVSDLAESEFGEFRPRGLDPVLRLLAEQSVRTPRLRLASVDVDAETGCADGDAFERDLGARTGDGGPEDLTLLVLQLDREAPPAHDGSAEAGRDRLAAFVAVLRRSFGPELPLYRVNRETFAVLAEGAEADALGERILMATCSTGPRFFWGRAERRALGGLAADAPDVLLMLALADLQFRRRELLDANRTVVRRREVSWIGAVAAGLLLVAGVAVSVNGAPASTTTPHVAIHSNTPPPGPSASVPSATVPPVVPALSPPGHSPAPVVYTPPASPAPAASHAVLASYTVPAPAVSVPPPPPPPAPVTPTTTTPAPGHSGGAPGHLKKVLTGLITKV